MRTTRTGGYGTFVAVVLALASVVPACAEGPRVTLHAAGGDVSVAAEVVATDVERSLGLMYRRELDAMAGMLFIFDETAEHSFWMKNTALALDMIFIDEGRTIVGIVKDARPYTTTARTVGRPSRYVLEVNAGFSDRHGIATGDRVSFVRVPALGGGG